MKRTILSVATAVAISSTAVVAGGDIAPVAPAPADSWSGFYIGAQAGYIWGDADTGIGSYNVDGFAGGLYAGYNWLLQDGFLVGIEADGNWMSGDDKLTVGSISGTIEQKWESSLRLRVGKVIDDTWMPYVTGGVAWTKLDYDFGTGGSGSDTYTGWTVGGGIEYKLTENVHAKLEYRYADYGDKSIPVAGVGKIDYTSHQVYLGVSYKF